MSASTPKLPGDQTSIDLGDDLLEEHATGSDIFRGPVVTDDGAVSPPLPSAGIDDQLQSASILLNEGFVEDAKRLLRKILIADPHSVVARKKLDEIHETELKQIFSDSPRPRASPYGKTEKARLPFDPGETLKNLDTDLSLGLAAEARTDEEKLAWSTSIDRALEGVSQRDRIDVGIAFLEMGLPWLATSHFRAARSQGALDFAATTLLAQALIASGDAFEATLCLQPLLTDTEIDRRDKVELYYLMGVACESLGQRDAALNWYRQVIAVDRYYRDASERSRRLERARGR